MTTLQALEYKGETSYARPRQPPVTEAEYWEKYYNDHDVIYEWNNGYLEEKPVSDYSTILMYKWFFEQINFGLRFFRLLIL
jgi:hypothetical protein